ncbi:uncharacterized protein LOC143024937 [Oratosquilla oratoria]|uniref:uncharacterized protein LOC143024937 n=1 Tax=Oratosquilla oratoria TaxID=337810 RepID=UPI003F76AC21
MANDDDGDRAEESSSESSRSAGSGVDHPQEPELPPRMKNFMVTVLAICRDILTCFPLGASDASLTLDIYRLTSAVLLTLGAYNIFEGSDVECRPKSDVARTWIPTSHLEYCRRYSFFEHEGSQITVEFYHLMPLYLTMLSGIFLAPRVMAWWLSDKRLKDALDDLKRLCEEQKNFDPQELQAIRERAAHYLRSVIGYGSDRLYWDYLRVQIAVIVCNALAFVVVDAMLSGRYRQTLLFLVRFRPIDFDDHLSLAFPLFTDCSIPHEILEISGYTRTYACTLTYMWTYMFLFISLQVVQATCFVLAVAQVVLVVMLSVSCLRKLSLMILCPGCRWDPEDLEDMTSGDAFVVTRLSWALMPVQVRQILEDVLG